MQIGRRASDGKDAGPVLFISSGGNEFAVNSPLYANPQMTDRKGLTVEGATSLKGPVTYRGTLKENDEEETLYEVSSRYTLRLTGNVPKAGQAPDKIINSYCADADGCDLTISGRFSGGPIAESASCRLSDSGGGLDRFNNTAFVLRMDAVSAIGNTYEHDGNCSLTIID